MTHPVAFAITWMFTAFLQGEHDADDVRPRVVLVCLLVCSEPIESSGGNFDPVHWCLGEVMYPHVEYRFLLLAGSLAIRHLPGS